MKRVSLSQLLSRSPRHGGRGGGRGEALEALAGPRPGGTPDRAPKKKGKAGILQTLKKKISGKLDACQGSHCSSPKKSKSFEGLSNSFGDSFSQSISEESSSDGLNASGGQTHKGKHNKRAIRPMHTPVARQNSSSRVLGEGEAAGGREAGQDLQQQPAAALCLYSTAPTPTHISEVAATEAPDSCDTFDGGTGDGVAAAPRVRVLVDAVAVGGTVDCEAGLGGCEGQERSASAITETSSPVSYGELWGPGPHDANIDASKRSLAEELFGLARFGWYWGPITRAEAEEKLVDQPDGAFLVRDSSDDKYLLSLSFRSYSKTLHTRIEHSNGRCVQNGFFLHAAPKR